MFVMMDYFNIVKILDVGLMEDGCLYFVMEFIFGKLLVEFVDEEVFLICEWFELFLIICCVV